MLLIFALSTAAFAEKELPVAELPAAVRSAVEARWPGAQILEAEREHGRYEVEILAADGQRLEVELSKKGVIREVEADDDEDEGEDEGEEEERGERDD